MLSIGLNCAGQSSLADGRLFDQCDSGQTASRAGNPRAPLAGDHRALPASDHHRFEGSPSQVPSPREGRCVGELKGPQSRQQMRGTIHQAVGRARLLLLAVALLFCCVPTAQAIRCPASERQPIAWQRPPIYIALEAASWSSRPCSVGRCSISYIRQDASTQGPPTSRAVLVNQAEAFIAGYFTVKPPANRVRGATASWLQFLLAAGHWLC